MPNIKEIALKHAREYLTFKLGGRKGCDIEEIVGDDEVYIEIVNELAGQFEALVAELAKGNEPVVIEEPDYYYEAMGCGLEDRNITDRYEAMKHGWDYAVFRFFEQIPDGPIYTLPPTASQIEQETAEACAKYASSQMSAPECPERAEYIAEGLRSGAWKEFKKS